MIYPTPLSKLKFDRLVLVNSQIRWFLLACLLLPSLPILAQLRITTPVSRMVFQRTQHNEANVLVAGLAPATANRVEARFVPLAIGQGAVTPWTTLDMLAGSSAFRGKVTVSAGWYRLDVRAKNGTTILTETRVNRVGVGEVFVVAGQSNAYGGFERVPSATDDRVSCIDFRQDSLSEQLLPLQFSRFSYGTSVGPSQPPHMWGLLGDKLVQRLNVPVLFLGAALGATSSAEWRQSAEGNIGNTPNLAVYRRLGAVLLHYVTRTGARAVLWHQGESDISTDNQTYYNNIRYVIEKSRQQLGSAPIPWVVSRASYIDNRTNPDVIAAQNRLATDLPQVFAGPFTDDLVGSENRPDNVHFQGAGLFRYTDRWDQSLPNTFFENAVPFMPSDESALITSGYTLPLTRRPGETIVAASLRSNPSEADNQYFAQIVRADNGTTVYESPRSADNPLLVTIPATLPDGQYRLRTLSTHPATTGTLGEPFTVRQSATPSSLPNVLQLPISGGTADPALQRVGYRYEITSHGFFAMAIATAPMEVRMQRLDGGRFDDSGWNPMPPSSQAPDYIEFADFNYIRNYPPIALAVGGVEPGRYRLSVRRQGDNGPGLWYETTLLNGRNILYYPMESIGAIPPVLTVNPPAVSACLSGAINVGVDVSDGVMNSGNTFSIRLSDKDGSFANETTIGSGSSSPVQANLPGSLPEGSNYRLRVVASSPAVASAPSDPLLLCTGQADLSLALRVDDRTPNTGQPVTLTLTVTNRGPASAAGIVVKSILPAGLDFFNAVSSGVSATSGIVTINAGTLATGATAPYVFRLKASQTGSFATAAQITASSLTDPDSQPGSGTGDGQDDAATVDLRTANGSGPLTVSPNPNQTPLPSVQSNQPPTDPAKADLSLSIRANNLVPKPNDVISVTLTVSNRGGSSASSVLAQAQLPTGWQLTNTNGFSLSGQTATGTIGSVPVGGSSSLVLSIRVSGPGTLQAQILSASPADSDSITGNGYTNGEDDQASMIVRTR